MTRNERKILKHLRRKLSDKNTMFRRLLVVIVVIVSVMKLKEMVVWYVHTESRSDIVEYL